MYKIIRYDHKSASLRGQTLLDASWVNQSQNILANLAEIITSSQPIVNEQGIYFNI